MKQDDLFFEILKEIPIKIYLFDTIDSTNNEAKRYALSGGEDTAVFLADSQSGGRGRMGRSFFSPSETGIYLSILQKTDKALSDIVCVTSAAAVAVSRAIETVTGVRVKIKWVNDLYFNGKKVCGILAESFVCGEDRYMVIGVGVNLCVEKFPEELENIAGALPNFDISRKRELIAQIIRELYIATSKLSSYDFIDEYRKHSLVLGKKIMFTENGISKEGIADAIDEKGRLLIKGEDSKITVLSGGEISLRLLNI